MISFTYIGPHTGITLLPCQLQRKLTPLFAEHTHLLFWYLSMNAVRVLMIKAIPAMGHSIAKVYRSIIWIYSRYFQYSVIDFPTGPDDDDDEDGSAGDG